MNYFHVHFSLQEETERRERREEKEKERERERWGDGIRVLLSTVHYDVKARGGWWNLDRVVDCL